MIATSDHSDTWRMTLGAGAGHDRARTNGPRRRPTVPPASHRPGPVSHGSPRPACSILIATRGVQAAARRLAGARAGHGAGTNGGAVTSDAAPRDATPTRRRGMRHRHGAAGCDTHEAPRDATRTRRHVTRHARGAVGRDTDVAPPDGTPRDATRRRRCGMRHAGGAAGCETHLTWRRLPPRTQSASFARVASQPFLIAISDHPDIRRPTHGAVWSGNI
jgi:hypothetical protein